MEERDILWAPWRGVYITQKKSEDCVFCGKASENLSDDNLLVYKGKYIYIVMNLYPYNNGHVMLVPYRHTADIQDLTDEETLEMAMLLRSSLKAIKNAIRAEGFNIGYNVGAVAGAGIAAHLHQHIVPRWKGDTNFMPIVAETKVISEHMHITCAKLRAEFNKILGVHV